MPAEVGFFGAMLVGFLGGTHCVGMCGGIVGALTFGLPGEARQGWRGLWPFLAAYNSARLLAYTAAGALMGGVGLLGASLMPMHQAQLGLQALAGVFMIALGLYIAGWWQGLARVERLGGHLWRRIEPLGRRVMPVRTPRQAFLLGFLWGWLPCGLVYSVLIWAMAAGGPAEGALLLLGFGLGTLPNLLLMGVFAVQLGRFMRKAWVRATGGGLVVLFGVYTLALSFGGLPGV